MEHNSFGNWLRDKRLDHGLTMTEFADKVGVSYVTLSNVELGKVTPGINFLTKLSEYLEMEYIDLRKILKGEHTEYDRS